MRHKFRGFEKSSGLWRYGFLLFDGEKHYIMQIIQGTLVKWLVDSNTVGQFVGLYDKNYREVYEDDILFVEFPDKSSNKYLVGWDKKNASWVFVDSYRYQLKQEGYDSDVFDNCVLLNCLNYSLDCEVIGNIHDNPELLRQ